MNPNFIMLVGVVWLTIVAGCAPKTPSQDSQPLVTGTKSIIATLSPTKKPEPEISRTSVPAVPTSKQLGTLEETPTEDVGTPTKRSLERKYTEEELIKFLVENTSLDQSTSFVFLWLESDYEAETETIVFFTSPALQIKRGIIRASNEGLLLTVFEDDPCNCDAFAEIYSRKLVIDQQEFVLTSYSPHTGTCVAYQVLRILSVEHGTSFKQVWAGFTYSAGSETETGFLATIFDIEFTDLDNDNVLDIVQTGKTINCGDECFCWEGPIEEEFQRVYEWDDETSTFVETISD